MRRIRKDDRVQVMSGKDRGRQGRVVKLFPNRDRLIVEGVNYVKKHQRMQTNSRGAQEGGIIETEAPLHISNVMPVCPSCERPVRVGFTLEDEADPRSKVRECRNCQATF